MTSNQLVIGSPKENPGYLLTFSDRKRKIYAQFGDSAEELEEEMTEYAVSNWDEKHMGPLPTNTVSALNEYFEKRAKAGEWYKIQDLQLN